MYFDPNHNVPHLVRPVHMPPTDWSFPNIDAVPSGKDKIPKRCFPYGNLGQECCTALLSVLHWEPGPRDLNSGLSIHSQMKSHLPVPALLLGPPRDARKLSHQHKQSRHPNQRCRPLSAPTRLGGPCCLVLQSFQVRSILQMAIQVNKSYKNQSSISKHCAVIIKTAN